MEKRENSNDPPPPPRWYRYYRCCHTSINRWENFLTVTTLTSTSKSRSSDSLEASRQMCRSWFLLKSARHWLYWTPCSIVFEENVAPTLNLTNSVNKSKCERNHFLWSNLLRLVFELFWVLWLQNCSVVPGELPSKLTMSEKPFI